MMAIFFLTQHVNSFCKQNMVRKIWCNNVSGNGLLPDVTKPLTEPMLTYHQGCFILFTLGQFHMKRLTYLSV